MGTAIPPPALFRQQPTRHPSQILLNCRHQELVARGSQTTQVITDEDVASLTIVSVHLQTGCYVNIVTPTHVHLVGLLVAGEVVFFTYGAGFRLGKLEG